MESSIERSFSAVMPVSLRFRNPLLEDEFRQFVCANGGFRIVAAAASCCVALSAAAVVVLSASEQTTGVVRRAFFAAMGGLFIIGALLLVVGCYELWRQDRRHMQYLEHLQVCAYLATMVLSSFLIPEVSALVFGARFGGHDDLPGSFDEALHANPDFLNASSLFVLLQDVLLTGLYIIFRIRFCFSCCCAVLAFFWTASVLYSFRNPDAGGFNEFLFIELIIFLMLCFFALFGRYFTEISERKAWLNSRNQRDMLALCVDFVIELPVDNMVDPLENAQIGNCFGVTVPTPIEELGFNQGEVDRVRRFVTKVRETRTPQRATIALRRVDDDPKFADRVTCTVLGLQGEDGVTRIGWQLADRLSFQVTPLDVPSNTSDRLLNKLGQSTRSTKSSPTRGTKSGNESALEKWLDAILAAIPLFSDWQLFPWISLVFLATTFTLIITPYEVSFVDDRTSAEMQFYIYAWNAGSTLLFALDIAVTFNSPVKVYQPLLKRWVVVTRRMDIARVYLKGWLFIDVIATLPYSFFFPHVAWIRILRLLRCLRFVMLLTKLRRSSIFEFLRDHIRVPSHVQDLFTLAFITTLFAHWLACILGLVAEEDGVIRAITYSGSGVGDDAKVDPSLIHQSHIRYLYMVYWGVVTLTSVGYGDIVPTTQSEVLATIIIILVGALYWAWVVGSVCSIVAEAVVKETMFKRDLGGVRRLVSNPRIPSDLAANVYKYVHQSKAVANAKEDQRLLDSLSPYLKASLIKHTVPDGVLRWGERYCRHLLDKEGEFFHCLVGMTEPALYAPREIVKVRIQRTLCAVEAGTAMRGMSILSPGDYWGDDFLLYCAQLRSGLAVVCLEYIRVRRLHYEQFEAVLEKFPSEYNHFRQKLVWLAARRGLVRNLEKHRNTLRQRQRSRRDPNSAAQSETSQLSAPIAMPGRVVEIVSDKPASPVYAVNDAGTSDAGAGPVPNSNARPVGWTPVGPANERQQWRF
jgi:hypothetical protein